MSSPPSHPRVAYVMTHYPKLAQTFIANEIDALEQRGVQVARFAMNPPEASERAREGADRRIAGTTYLKATPLRAVSSLLGQTLSHPLAMTRVWNMALASSGGDLRRAVRRLAHLAQAALLADGARRLGITRLHAHFGLAPATIAWLAWAIARAQGRKTDFSFTIHGYHDFADPAEARLDLKARDAAGVLCISDFTRSQLCLITEPALWPKFHVARCGIDLSDFAFRGARNLDPVPTVLALGRLSPEKGFAVLIEAVALSKEAGVPVRLRIVGDGPHRGALEAAARARGIADSVSFAGELSPDVVREELQAADIFCVASFSEGLPVSLMEAMAVGVPCIATWIAGIPELAENEVTALTVPPARADSLALAIARLVNEPDLRLRLARSARERVEQSHDLAVCTAHVRHLLLGGDAA
jgi:glycosyltransferase involved in cell wall biosynthesis